MYILYRYEWFCFSVQITLQENVPVGFIVWVVQVTDKDGDSTELEISGTIEFDVRKLVT